MRSSWPDCGRGYQPALQCTTHSSSSPPLNTAAASRPSSSVARFGSRPSFSFALHKGRRWELTVPRSGQKGTRTAAISVLGESFVFSFTTGNGSCYAWVGTGCHTDLPASSRLFQCADHNMIQIGGGGGAALYLDSSLEHGRTQHCDTFENPPLVKSGEFVVSVLEVLGFE